MRANEASRHRKAQLCEDHLPPGRLLDGRFMVVRRISATAMSTVYYGYDLDSDQKIAIKHLSTAERPAGLPRSSAIRVLVGEALLLQEIEQAQLPQLISIFCEQDDYYLVTTYVEGRSLDQILAGGELAPRRAWRIARSLCDAVEGLHRQDPPVIHGDIKPNNMIVGPGDRVTLLDLGLSRRCGEPPALDAIMGTPPYTAPEQWAGEPLDQRSDIYSLGRVLDEIFEVARCAAPRRALARATAQAPADRFESVGQLRRAIAAARAAAERRSPARELAPDCWSLLGLLAIVLIAELMSL